MSGIYQWDILIEELAGEAIAEFMLSDSWFEDGPIVPGTQSFSVCGILIRNIGNYGNIYAKCVKYPNTPQEELIELHTFENVSPNNTVGAQFWTSAPSSPGILQIGVKVWGDAETEPSW